MGSGASQDAAAVAAAEAAKPPDGSDMAGQTPEALLSEIVRMRSLLATHGGFGARGGAGEEAKREAPPMPFRSFTATSKSVVLNGPLPAGVPSGTIGEHFSLKEEEITVATLQPGEVLCKVLCMSADPVTRGRITSAAAGTVLFGYVGGKVGARAGAAYLVEPGACRPAPEIAPRRRPASPPHLAAHLSCLLRQVLASADPRWRVGQLFGAKLHFKTLQVAVRARERGVAAAAAGGGGRGGT